MMNSSEEEEPIASGMTCWEHIARGIWRAFTWSLIVFGNSVILSLFFDPRIVFIVAGEIFAISVLILTYRSFSFVRLTRMAKRGELAAENGDRYE